MEIKKQDLVTITMSAEEFEKMQTSLKGILVTKYAKLEESITSHKGVAYLDIDAVRDKVFYILHDGIINTDNFSLSEVADDVYELNYPIENDVFRGVIQNFKSSFEEFNSLAKSVPNADYSPHTFENVFRKYKHGVEHLLCAYRIFDDLACDANNGQLYYYDDKDCVLESINSKRKEG